MFLETATLDRWFVAFNGSGQDKVSRRRKNRENYAEASMPIVVDQPIDLLTLRRTKFALTARWGKTSSIRNSGATPSTGQAPRPPSGPDGRDSAYRRNGWHQDSGKGSWDFGGDMFRDFDFSHGRCGNTYNNHYNFAQNTFFIGCSLKLFSRMFPGRANRFLAVVVAFRTDINLFCQNRSINDVKNRVKWWCFYFFTGYDFVSFKLCIIFYALIFHLFGFGYDCKISENKQLVVVAEKR